MMNERIKELAKQAGAGWDDKYHWYVGSVAMEKFTELIVKECADLLWDESERLYEYSGECDNMRDSDEAEVTAQKCLDHIEMLREHFGFE